MNFGVTDLLKFWTGRIVDVDAIEREKPSLGLLLEKGPDAICLRRSEEKVELRMGGEDIYSLRTWGRFGGY